MNQRLLAIAEYARRSIVVSALLAVVVMVFAGSNFGPSVSDGPAAKTVITVLSAPQFLVDLDAPFFDQSPALALGASALVQFLYFLIISIAIRAIVAKRRSRCSMDAP
jgi:hypothetical protein